MEGIRVIFVVIVLPVLLLATTSIRLATLELQKLGTSDDNSEFDRKVFHNDRIVLFD